MVLPPAASDLQKDGKHFQKYPFSHDPLRGLLGSAIKQGSWLLPGNKPLCVRLVFLRGQLVHLGQSLLLPMVQPGNGLQAPYARQGWAREAVEQR